MIQLTLCLTHDCNLRCGYCYAGKKHPHDMPKETAFRGIELGIAEALKEGAAKGTSPKIQFGFFGGEPLLEWDLLTQCYEYAMQVSAQVGICPKWAVTTNMTLLTQERAKWLLERDFYVGLSLDGNERMHGVWRKYADGSNSHADCVRALPWFKGHECRTAIACVVNPRNVCYLAESVRWLAEICRIKILLNPDFSADWSESALAELSRAYQEIGELTISMYRENRRLTVNVIQSKIATYVKGGYAECDKCSLGEREMAVAVSGNMYPCARLVGDDDKEHLCMGNVLTGINPEKRLQLQAARGNNNPMCLGCVYRNRCVQWCGCVNEVTSGRTDWVGEFTCYHERLSISVADYVAETLWKERNPLFIREFYS